MGNASHKLPNDGQGKSENHKSYEGDARSGASFRSAFGSFRSCASRYSLSSRRTKYSKSFSTGDSDFRKLDKREASWPIAYFEAIFLGEFRLRNNHFRSNYQMVRELASGSFGKVYVAKNKTRNEDVAVKILSKAQIIQEAAVPQMKDEVSIQLMCGHNPFIIPCIEYWQERKEIFIVSELAENGDMLTLWSKHGRMEESLARIYLVQIASAVDFLHNAGVIYRDLKLENVVLKLDGSVKIVDFGLSKWLRLGQKTRTICGTLYYMAPEVLRGDPYGHAVDFWSLGVVLFAMLAGEHPFPCPDASSVMEMQTATQFHLPQFCSQYAQQLINFLLRPNPEERLRSFLALAKQGFLFGCDVDKIRSKQITPKDLFENWRSNVRNQEEHFRDFDS